MVMYLVFINRTYHIVSWRFTILLCGEIGCQRYQSMFGATEEIRDRRIDHLAVDNVPYTFRTVCGFFDVPFIIGNNFCQTGATVDRPYPRRLESLTICRCRYKGSSFSSVI